MRLIIKVVTGSVGTVRALSSFLWSIVSFMQEGFFIDVCSERQRMNMLDDITYGIDLDHMTHRLVTKTVAERDENSTGLDLRMTRTRNRLGGGRIDTGQGHGMTHK